VSGWKCGASPKCGVSPLPTLSTTIAAWLPTFVYLNAQVNNGSDLLPHGEAAFHIDLDVVYRGGEVPSFS
jgi:hypothetical protein